MIKISALNHMTESTWLRIQLFLQLNSPSISILVPPSLQRAKWNLPKALLSYNPSHSLSMHLRVSLNYRFTPPKNRPNQVRAHSTFSKILMGRKLSFQYCPNLQLSTVSRNQIYPHHCHMYHPRKTPRIINCNWKTSLMRVVASWMTHHSKFWKPRKLR